MTGITKFDTDWWKRFTDYWNSSTVHAQLAAPTAFVIIVTNVASVRLVFSEDSHCSVSPIQDSGEVPSFSADTEVWRNVLTGTLPVEKAVLAGHIDFRGTMSFLAENWDLLREVIETGSQMVDIVPAGYVLAPTDFMIHARDYSDVVAVLRDQLGMRIETESDSWTMLVHPETMQRIVVTIEPLPLSSMAIGCEVFDLDAALVSLASKVRPEQISVARHNRYAHVSLYNTLSLLLYQNK